jgi:two-component system response regulator RegX3
MEQRFKILIIEHEENVRQGLMAVFDHHHFDVEATDSAITGYEKACSGEFDLLLLDSRMRELDAFEFCTAVRLLHPRQVIFILTADSNDQALIDSLSHGADDYTSVPFAYTDLVQRAKALLRRSRLQNKNQSTKELKLGGNIAIDCLNLSGKSPQGEFEFTHREIKVLEYLYENRGKTVEAYELLHQVWGYPRYLNTETRAVNIHIATLQKKLEIDPDNPQILKPVGDQAYQLLV